MLEHFEMSDGLGAIYPSMMNAIIALRCLGYSLDDPQVIRAMDEFEKLGIEEEDTFRMQPCMSPVWDTAYALFALGEAGVPADDPRMVKCADWILQKQVRNRRRLEGQESRRDSRADGTSSSTTSFIRMWMTAQWFAWG